MQRPLRCSMVLSVARTMEQTEQDLPGGQAGPGVMVEDPMVIGEVPLVTQAHQSGGRMATMTRRAEQTVW